MVKQFTSDKDRSAGVSNPVDLEFKVDDDEFTVKAPTTGQLMKFSRENAKGGMRSIVAMFNFLENLMSEEDTERLDEMLDEGVDVYAILDAINWMIEEWAEIPTKPRSGSSPSRKTTGKSSTAKRRSTAKTS